MKIFSYAMIYAFIVFLIYLFIKFFRFAYVHLKAYFIRRKFSKISKSDVNLDSVKKVDTEKKDD